MFIPEGSRVLFLDDDSERHKVFSECMDHRFEVTHTKKFFETLKILRAESFHTVFLDHDLGDHVEADVIHGMYSNHVANGEDVARWIVNTPESHPKQCVVHSANPDGAKNIAAWMRKVCKVEVAPFTTLYTVLRKSKQ
jgi:CheY-like chemotaxis protein